MAALNEIIHQPARLRIMSALTTLNRAERLDFATLRGLLDLTDGNLGAHLAKLEDAGYVQMEKEFIDRKPRTYLSVTPKGRAAFEEHVVALRSILNG